MPRLWLRLYRAELLTLLRWILSSRCHVSVHCLASVQASGGVHATVVDTVVVVEGGDRRGGAGIPWPS